MSKVPATEKTNIYEAALASFGFGHQLGKAVEELGELLVELGKVMQGKADLGSIAGEMADVSILMKQLQMHYGIEELTEDFVDYKTVRLRERVVARQMAEEQMG